jgi:hypothetical protein
MATVTDPAASDRDIGKVLGMKGNWSLQRMVAARVKVVVA